MQNGVGFILVSVLLGLGCNALDKPGVDGNSKRVVPIDVRPVQQALLDLPPISGGTLAVSPDGAIAVAADPDRDRISIVTLGDGSVRELALEAGDEPGRVVIDTHARAHIALRRAGDLVSVELSSGELSRRSHVCGAARGVAYDATSDVLYVACADGKLVSLRAADGQMLREIDLGSDLRDVAVRGEELWVSTFKQAQLLRVDAAGAVVERLQPPAIRLPPDTPSKVERAMQPQLAWRMLPTADGAIMLHQQEASSQVDVSKKPDDSGSNPQGSAYGGGGENAFACPGIVTTGVTRLDSGGMRTSVALGNSVLAVDMALSPLDGTVAIAQAGSPDPQAPRPFTVFGGSSSLFGSSSPGIAPPSDNGSVGPGRVVRFRIADVPEPATSAGMPTEANLAGCLNAETVGVPGQPTALAFTAQGQLLVQSREPASLTVLPSASAPGQAGITIDLGGQSVFDTGHELFHRDSGGGIACASCHAEGAEDGHTWLFSDVGKRRTQALHVGLQGTAPFHWNGDLHDIGALMEAVLVGRMGGVHQSDARRDALQRWLFSLRPPTPAVDPGDPSAERGKALFDSGALGCSGCHHGAKFTDNQSYDVGSGRPGERLQVPSLRGVGYRAPFIHTGCAATLRERFDPSCGGARHGNTAQLDAAQLDDLIAYLRSL